MASVYYFTTHRFENLCHTLESLPADGSSVCHAGRGSKGVVDIVCGRKEAHRGWYIKYEWLVC